MTGSDNITFQNCNFTNCTSGTNGGGLDWLAGANHGKVINCTFNNTRAARSAGAIYYDGDYGRMENITIINATNYGGSLPASKDGRVKYAGWDASHWDTNTTGGDAGAIMFTGSHEYLYNVTFTDCYSVGRGGAIFLQGAHNVTIDYCNFTGNFARGIANNTWNDYKSERNDSNVDTKVNYDLTGHGGAIAFDTGASDNRITGSYFTDNYARRDGGSIYFAKGSLNNTIEYSEFNNSRAGDDGGVIFIDRGSGNCTIDHISCYNTTAESIYDSDIQGEDANSHSNGGAICLTGDNVTISNSKFDTNYIMRSSTDQGYKYYKGAALYITGDHDKVYNSTFTNSGIKDDEIDYINGGTIYILGNNTIISGCNISNTSANQGGSIYVEGHNATIELSNINSTKANQQGGAIYVTGENATVIDSNITNSSSLESAGAMFISGNNANINGTSFVNCTTPGAHGGAICITGNGTVIFNSTFENCNATLVQSGEGKAVGGAIHISGNNATIIKSNFTRNFATDDGGAIYVTGADCKLYNSTFSTNIAGDDGGAILWKGERGLISNTNFTGNRGVGMFGSHSKGGTLNIVGNYSVVEKSKFEFTSATTDGGAIYATGHDINITDSSFAYCNVSQAYEANHKHGGGAIYIEGHNATLENCSFDRANARLGGIIYVQGHNATIYNATSLHTFAIEGGAIYVAGDNATISKSNIIMSNSTTSSGGAIYIKGANTNISESYFSLCIGGKDSNSVIRYVDGGAIYVNGTNTVIEKSTFNRNNVSQAGGAIYVHGNNTQILDCNFSQSHARIGGFIYIDGPDAIINGSSFMMSSVDTSGGAIYVNGTNATIEKSSFGMNNATNNGGAIYVEGNFSKIIDSNFTVDIALTGSGGAIYVGGVNANISGVRTNITQALNGYGGSIYVYGKNTIINGSDILASHSEKEGGAIYIYGDDSKVIDSNITRTSNTKGGAIYIYAKNAVISGSNFNMNNATTSGGAVFIEGINASIINSTFNNTYAKSSSGYIGIRDDKDKTKLLNPDKNNHGGAIYIKGDNANISGSKFENSFAYSGGTIFLEGSHCEVTNSSFKGGHAYASDFNKANIGGGAIFSTGSYNEIYYSNFTDNIADGNGGAILWYGGDKSTNNIIVGCIFTDNVAHGAVKENTKGGGAVYWSEDGRYGKILNSNFTNNYVNSTNKADGGAVLWDNNYHVLLDGCTFDGNYITSTNLNNANVWVQGGALFFRSKDNYTVSNCVFKNCWSIKEAGAIYISNKGGGVGGITVVNVTFINNTANGLGTVNTMGGGAILAKETKNTWFTNLKFINNTANVGGGLALRTDSNSVGDSIYFTNCTFIGNNATENGGGLYAYKYLRINNASFYDNHADNDGGGLYVADNSADSIKVYKDLTFINNSAKYNGGGFYWNKQGADIHDILFANNSAAKGGAIYVPLSGATVSNNNFTKNNATYGGAIYVAATGATISFNNFTKNNATYGGAIYTPFAGSSISIFNLTFDENHAKYGGAIYLGFTGDENKPVIYCNFTNNTANVDGGAIYVNNTGNIICYCAFDGNNASGNGGSVYVTANLASTSIHDSTFENSHAYDGGAVYNQGSSTATLLLVNDTFINNIASHNGGAILYINNGRKYRDYNKFDNIAVISDITGRTNVSDVDQGTRFITDCLIDYDTNHDYIFDITVVADSEAPIISIYLQSPNDASPESINFVVTISNKTYSKQIIVTESNYDTHYNALYHLVYVDFDSGLKRGEKYNITVSFNDANYMLKEFATNETAQGADKGQFAILQEKIDRNITLQQGDVYIINLTKSYRFTYDDFNEVWDTGCMNLTNIDKPLIINGNGWILDARGYSRIFNITASNVTFVNVKFANGNGKRLINDTVSIGGAIFWAGDNGKLINSTIVNSNATRGGGIYYNVTASNCTIINTTFFNNTAVTYGGAIDCNASRMRLENTTFETNYADYGAALCREINATRGSGFNNTFIDNHAGTAGAALAWINATSISIDTYYFYNNTAGLSGGAIYVGEGSLTCEVHNCVFEDNYVDNNTGGHGGAIEWYSQSGLVNNSYFARNHAYHGGAVYVGFGSKDINITNSDFYENYAIAEGGAIGIEASSVRINESNFYDNSATDGGAIYVGGTGSTDYVYYSVFVRNTANGTGGAIDWVASSGHVANSNFTSNCAYYGGGVYLGGNSAESAITKCIFTDNHAKYKGGAIDANASKMNLTHTLFDANYAQYGAALCREVNAIGGFGENVTFINNHAHVSGAALGWMGSVNITIRNYTFINNSADVSGGAIYVGPDSHNCSIINSYFENNYVTNETTDWEYNRFTWTAWDGTLMTYSAAETDNATLVNQTIMGPENTVYYYNYTTNPSTKTLDLGVGGAIGSFAANATIIDSNFTNNAARLGGAVYMGADSGNTAFNRSIFANNTAYESGGAINLHASAAHIDNVTFYNNIAVDGAALYVGGSGTENKVHWAIFEGNNASGYGAGIYWKASAGEIFNSEFTNNHATYGAGIYLNGVSSNTNITNVTFKYNNATKNGGAIDCNASNIGLYNTTFTSNYAGEYGAALCREVGATSGHGKNNTFISNHAGISGAALAWMNVDDININYYYFINNTAGFSGAAIYISEGSDNCVINNSDFRGNNITNTTGGQGGAIDIVGDDAIIANSNFTNNHAFYGGAVFAGRSSGNTQFVNATFERNGATVDGGAMEITGSGVTLNDTRFYSNVAGGSGGALNVYGEGITNAVYYCEFVDNTATDHGGAINWLAYAGEVYYSNFTHNSAIYGGAIYLNHVSSSSKISNVIFENNTASKNGGAIDCNASRMMLNNTIFKYNVANDYGAALCREAKATNGSGGNNTFIGNYAGIGGAALAWLGVDGININNYTFINNTVGDMGGAIYVQGDSPNCKVRNSYFENNYVTDKNNGKGGDIAWLGANGYVFNSTFVSSYAAIAGSILFGNDNMSISYSNFSFTTSLLRGGAIGGHHSSNSTIDNCIFNYTISAGFTSPALEVYGDGGAIYWHDAENVTISNSKFFDIQAHGNGGAICIMDVNNTAMDNLTFDGEMALEGGGSIAVINSINATISSSSFADTAASRNGGSIYLYNAENATVRDSKFMGTYAPWGNGGAIYINGNASVDNCSFVDYDALNDNAGIFVYAGNANITNSTFKGIYSIWVNVTATAYIAGNNMTSDVPNKDMTFLGEQDYDIITHPVPYSVWNDGEIYLKGNNFDNIIFNNGTITSPTTMYVLDNETWEGEWNTSFVFWGNITDDNNNTIISVSSFDTYNNLTGINGTHYLMPYNRNRNLTLSYQDCFTIFGQDKGLTDCTMKPGVIKVKMPTKLEISTSDITQEDITFTATITTPYNSNHTVKDQPVQFTIHDESGKQKDVILNATINVCDDSWNKVIAELIQNHMHVGTYTVTATYFGDSHHYNSTATMLLILESHPIELIINAADIYYGQTLVINVTSNATNTENGRISIKINGKEIVHMIQLEKNGTKIVNITYDEYKNIITEPAEYTLSVTFSNGTYYQQTSNDTAVQVMKLNATIGASAIATIDWGDPEIIDVTIGRNETVGIDVTGFVKLTIGNEDYIKEIENGHVQFSIPNLAPGNYENIRIQYMGDDYYNQNSTKVTFIVNQKSDYVFDVKVDDISYGQNATVRVALPDEATGTVTIYIDGIERGTVPVTPTGAILENITGLAGGEHTVKASYTGDTNFVGKDSTVKTFMVNPTTDWKLTITSSEKPYGENTTVTITALPYNVTGKNVTITVNNVAYVVNLTNGTATLTLSNLSAGGYTSTVEYAGDANYSSKKQTFRVNIAQAKPTITVTQNGYDLIATVTGNVTGNVTFRVNNKEYTVNLTGNTATLIGKLKIGDNYVIATYNGNKNYTTAEIADVFNVPRLNTTITVQSANIKYGENELINVTVDPSATGFIAVRIGTQIYVSYINQGVARFNITGLAAKTYSDVNVTYYPDTTDYNRNSTTTTFKVDPTNNYDMDVKVDDIIYGQNATVRVLLPTDASGDVEIYIDGVLNSTVPVINSVAVLENITGLAGGSHTVDVKYLGCDEYAPREITGKTFKVNPTTDWKFNIEADEHPYGEVTTIRINTGNYRLLNSVITLKINNVDHTVTLDSEGKGTLTLNDLPAGTYVSSANYDGDNNYAPKSQTFRVNIAKANPTLTISDVGVVYVGDEVTITVTKITDGELTVKVDDVEITNGKFTPSLEGKYTITVDSAETANYNAGHKTLVFNVAKRASQINVTATGDNVGSNAIISVQVPANATGYVTVNVNGTNYTINLTGGVGSVQIAGLGNGTYYVNATYLGDDQYLTSYNNKTFEMTKVDASMTITVEDIDYGQSANITVKVTSPGAAGYITIRIDDVRNITLPIVDGKANWIVSGLGANDYVAYANYSGDGKYKSHDEISKTFKVNKVSPGLSFVSFEGTVYDKATVSLIINGETHGEYVTVKVGDETSSVQIKDGGLIEFTTSGTLDEIKAYDIEVTYAGNANFTDATLSTTGTPKKITNYALIITAMNITFGDTEIITVKVPDHVNDVVIWVNGTAISKQSATGFENNEVKFDITYLNLKQGVYTVTATVNDTEFDHKNFTALFTVNKTYVPMNITVFNNESIKVGDTVKIVVSVPKDVIENVTIEINNIRLTNVTDANGNATFYIPDITYGNKTVVAVYAGDDTYFYNSTTANFTVNKRQSQLNVSATGGNVGASAEIKVEVQDNATGYVTVDINGTDYTIKLNDVGTGSISIPGLGNGTYYVHATYIGDDQYLSRNNNAETFTINNNPSKVNVTATNATYGNDSVITVKVPTVQTGYVTITVNDTLINVTVKIVNGEAKFNASGLDVGRYVVNVTYLGDKLYIANTNSTYFNITKANLTASAVGLNVTVEENAGIVIAVPSDFDGKVKVSVNNIIKYNDKAVPLIDIGKFDADSYAANVTFYGSKNYNDTSMLVRFNVTRVAANMTVTIDDTTYPNKAIAVVKVEGASGVINITVDGKVFNGTLVNGEVSIDLIGLSGGVKEATVNFTTSDKHNFNATTAVKFTVLKHTSTIEISQEGIDVMATITPNGATGTVTFYVNGKKFEADIISGVARWDDVLEIGNNTVVAVYSGDINYTESQNSVNFTVPRVESSVSVTATNVPYGNASEITVKVPTVQTGYVTITVNDTLLNVTVKLVNGVAKFNVTGLSVGRYIVNVTYLGDDTYDVSENHTYFNITKANLNATVIAQNVTVEQNPVFIINVNDDFDGKVQINISDIKYDDKVKPLIEIAKLPAGTYTANVTFYGSKNYNDTSMLVRFNVTRVAANMTVTIDDTTYPNKAIAVVKVEGASGVINITVDGKVFNGTLVNGEVSIDLIGLSGGVKEATVNFTTSDKHNFNATTAVKFTVYRHASEITLEKVNVNDLVAHVTVGTTGDVIFYINGVKSSVSIDANGVATLPTALEVGLNHVVAVYAGDSNYTGSQAYKDFNIGTVDSEVNVTATTVVYGNDTEITVKVPIAQKGYVTISVNNTINLTAAIVNGEAKFNVSGLNVGRYIVNVTYLGDGKFSACENYTYFNITKADLTAIGIGLNVTVKEDGGIVISVPSDFAGKVKVNVSDIKYDGEAIPLINIGKFDAGSYTANVTFYGDNNYNDKSINVRFNVSRVIPIINVTIDDTTYPNNAIAYVNVSDYANGTVNITVDGKVFNGTVVNGVATVVMEGLSGGVKVDLINFTATDKYHFNVTTTMKSVVIPKQSTITIDQNDKEVVATVTDGATGKVTFYINGVEYKDVDIVGGKATIPNVLVIGNNTVVAIYDGNVNYTSSRNYANFTVARNTALVNVSATTVVYGNDSVITVKVPTAQTGYVRIVVNGTTINVTAEIINGEAKFNASGLSVGRYMVNVTYLGDKLYDAEENSTYFNITKADLTASAIGLNVTVKEDVGIIINVPSDFAGKVKVNVSDIKYDGEAVSLINIGKFDADSYTANITFYGDNNYNNKSILVKFNVTRVAPNMTVTIDDTTYPGKAVAVVKVDGASGVINITVDGKLFNGTLTNGEVSIDLTGLSGGVKEATVDFTSTDNYNFDANVAAKFTVYRQASVISFVNDDKAVVAIITPGTTGNVTFYINGKEYNATINNGEARVDDVLRYGNNSIVAVYAGDRNFTGYWNSVNITVDKLISQLTINVSDITVDQTETIKVNVTSGATGQVIITVGDKQYYTEIDGGFATLKLDNLADNTYTVKVKYLGDENYSECDGQAIFTVSKLSSNVIVSVDNITCGDVAAINITVITNATGNVTVQIGNEYTTTVGVVDGIIRVIVPGLTAGNKTVEVTYNGDGRFLPSSAAANFTVEKATASVNVIVGDTTYGEKVPVTVLVNGTGTVTIEVVGEYKCTIDLLNGKAEDLIEGLKAGNYTLKVTYNGNDGINKTTVEAKFEVAKADPTITVEVEDIAYGDTEYIIIKSNAEGTVNVTVNGKTVEVTLNNGHAILRASRWDVPTYKGEATVEVQDLGVGKYPVEVTFNGNENYNVFTTNAVFNVVKDNTTIDIEAESSIKVGDTQVINITVDNANATGKVTVNVDGKNYTVEITNGHGQLKLGNLTGGNYTINAYYEGDGNLTGSWASMDFEVERLDADMHVDVANSTAGNKQTITVTVPENATGQVLFDINDKHYYANVTNGVAKLEIDTLPSDDYSMNVTYLGDENYAAKSYSSEFKVTKNNSTVNITSQNISFGENEQIIFTVPEDATGNLTVVVNGKTYTVAVSGGIGNLTISGLSADNYTIDVTYNGDGKYEPSTNSTKFEVTKAAFSPDDIKVVDQGNGTVVIVVPNNATGNITIKVEDKLYEAPIRNGVAVVNIDNSTPGVHDIEVIYSGDDNYENASAMSQASIPKYVAPMNVTVEDTAVDNDGVVTVSLPENATGNVTIEIDGKKYVKEVHDGVATFNVGNLTAGIKTISVDYSGDDNYAGNHTTANMTVTKVTPDISIGVVTDGDDIIVDVIAPGDVTDPVLVDVNGKGYYVNITEGKGQLVIPHVAGGNYTVIAKYPGDDKYNAYDAGTKSVTVSNIPSTVSVKVDDITYGDNAVIEVTVPDDATGNVTVTIDGKSYTANVSGGKATVVVPDLKAGNHTVDVKYSGDDKYNSSTDSADLEVAKAVVTSEDIKVIDQHNGTVVVVVPEGATGSITIKVGDKEYEAPIENGEAVVNIGDLTSGIHDVEVTYSGDENHTDASTTASITTSKAETPITITVEDINVGDKAIVKVTVPENATGNVTLEIDGVNYTAEIKNGVATFEIADLTAGNKTIVADYAGDGTYLANYTTDKLTVSKRTCDANVTIYDVDVGDNVIVSVSLPEDATGQVLIDIDGVGYYANVTNGVAIAEIPRVPGGNYTVYVTYTGDDKYASSSAKSSLNVSKVDSFVIPTAVNITAGDVEVIKFTLPDDATGTVTVVIDGVKYDLDAEDGTLSSSTDGESKYTVAINKGSGELVISGLTKGDYVVSVQYNGDEKYLPSTNTTRFSVNQSKSDVDISDEGNGTVVVVLPEDASGNVTVVIDGVNSTATVENGTVNVNLDDATPGKHNVTIIYTDGTGREYVINSTVEVPKYETPITVEVSDAKVGEPVDVVVNVPDGVTGNITLEIDGKQYSSKVENGKAKFKLDGLSSGGKTLIVKYGSDEYYLGNITTTQFEVSKSNSTINANSKDIVVGKDETITVTLPSDATGSVVVRINGVGYYGNVVNGKAKIVVPKLDAGNYKVTIKYEGDEKYLPSTTTTSFVVSGGKQPSISIIADDIVEGEDATIIVKVPSDATGTVTIVVDGQAYTNPVKDGKAIFIVSGLTEGTYIINAHYSGDEIYNSTDEVGFIVVKAKEKHHGGDNPASGVDLSKYPTANPILVLLLALLAIGSTQLRRFRK